MSRKITCDKCNKDFDLNTKVKKHKDGVEEVYFKCPHCKVKYTSYFTDKNIRIKQNKINKLWDKYRNVRTKKEIVSVLEEIEILRKEIKADMKELKRKMLCIQ